MSNKSRMIRYAAVGLTLSAVVPAFEAEPRPLAQTIEASPHHDEASNFDHQPESVDFLRRSLGALTLADRSTVAERTQAIKANIVDEADSTTTMVSSVRSIRFKFPEVNYAVNPEPPVDPKIEPKLDKLSQCESNGRWDINTGNGYYGGLQFNISTWISNGGAQFAPRADLATAHEQKLIAEKLYHSRGWQPWPGCAKKYGWL